VLSHSEVSSDIAAMLLFIISGYPSDAHEIARSLRSTGASPAATQLIFALRDLVSGSLDRVLNRRVSTENVAFSLLADEDAIERLWEELLYGVQALARALLGLGEQIEAATAVFQSVMRSSVRQLEGIAFSEARADRTQSIYSTYAGPHHLASLLLLATDRLSREAVVSIPAPPTVPAGTWLLYLQNLAKQRPYLWENHVDAVARGYLHHGVSSVVTFPTGAGKSTLAELKIAATAMSGRGVIFLVPTRALVWQVFRTLEIAFPDALVTRALVDEGGYDEVEEFGRPAIMVMTPEKCLSAIAASQMSLDELGLLIIDECHLLHPKTQNGDRRSIDATLCLLTVIDLAPQCDLLLMSAMVRNGDELAEWVEDITTRTCLSLAMDWKPTRQARGCVVYDHYRIQDLREDVRLAFDAATTKTPPKWLQRRSTARAYGLFGLTQAWSPELSTRNYTLVPLLEDPVQLGVVRPSVQQYRPNPRWRLTSNKNHVVSVLAARMTAMGTKVIVFVQNRAHCTSVANEIASLAHDELEQRSERRVWAMTDSERALFESAAEDLGGPEYVLGPVRGVAAPHNSWLLASERRLNEEAFRRRDGISVLIATPTLAQGMNLPAEAVLITGDMRFDQASMQQAQLSAHELLNAAGRAGRAGHSAAGLVLIVPDQLVSTDEDLEDVDGPWRDLTREIFSKKDQCLTVIDPIGLMLDRVQVAAPVNDRLVRYFLTRLPLDERMENPEDVATRMLSRSLAAFQARKRSEPQDFALRVSRALSVRRSLHQLPERVLALDRIASSCGIPNSRIRQLENSLRASGIIAEASTESAVQWLFGWLARDPTSVFDLIDEDALKSALSASEWSRVERNRELIGSLLPAVERRLLLWLKGSTLQVIEADLAGTQNLTSFCQRARVFADRFALAMSYLGGALAQVAREILQEGLRQEEMPSALGMLSPCIREGFDSPEKLALHYLSDPYTSRVRTHGLLQELRSYLPIGAMAEPFSTTRSRVRTALDLRMSLDF
jgi:superfamily II DNA/RNA helicase